MRARNPVVFVALAALVCLFVCVAPTMATGKTAGLDGHVRNLGFSKSVPNQLNYQGYLVDAADSVAINATLEMTFRLYDSEIKGVELWSETHPAVEVSNGLFQVLLGSVTAFPGDLFDGSTLWLQTEVGVEVLSPRKPLISVAYGIRAETADHAATSDWATDAQHAVHADTAAFSQTAASTVADSAAVADDAHHLEGQALSDLDGRWVNQGDLDHLDAADGDPANALYVDATGNVGVGTTSPAEKLDVAGTVKMTGLKMTAGASDGYVLTSNVSGEGSWLPAAGGADGDWTISGSDMYSAVSGNVGIGTASPAQKLHVAGSVKVDNTLFSSNLSSNSPLQLQTAGTTRLYIDDATGNVGIGTTSPAEKFHVAGDIRLNAGGDIAFYDDNTRVYEYSNDLFLTADDDIYLQPDDDVRILADGGSDWIRFNTGTQRVGIGTMSPSANLDVRPSGASYTIRSEWDGSSLGAALLAKNTGTGGDAIQAIADGSGRSAIYASGSSGVGYAIWASANGATWAGYFSGKAYVSEKIGIGTTNPKNKLDVEGAMVVGSSYSGSNTAPTNGLLVQGNIGLGTTNPQNKLDVEGAMVVGSSYSGSSTAPSNGLLVQGNVGMGTSSPGSHRLYAKSSVSGVGGSTVYVENDHSSGIAGIFDGESSDLVVLVSQHGSGDILRCDSWTGGWHPVFKVENDGRVVCSVLELTGGSDLSEQFEVKTGEADAQPGMLVSIDPKHPGELTLSTQAYDHKVAGIISGAGGIETGMLMGQRGSSAVGSYPIALTGRVYCWADAADSSILPGDLLTTSDISGHAMKVTDHARAQGAVIGKAMSSLKEGRGLVLVLVTLQ
ncbi:hypothetical protein KAX22_07585 [bacterium]|nr:hypothetical protein [bacterium]